MRTASTALIATVVAVLALAARVTRADSMCVSLAQAEIASERRQPPPASSEARTALNLRRLLAWCADDASCRALYHQTTGRDEAVFRFLVRSVYAAHANDADGGGGLYAAVRELLCVDYGASRLAAQSATPDGAEAVATDAALDDATRATWLRLMLAERPHDGLLCDVNHRLWFDADTMRAECVCREDRRCDDQLHSPTLMYMIMALGLAIAAGLFVLQVTRMVTEMGFITEVLTHKEAHTPIEESILLLHDCL